jgi:hypothetical protein
MIPNPSLASIMTPNILLTRFQSKDNPLFCHNFLHYIYLHIKDLQLHVYVEKKSIEIDLVGVVGLDKKEGREWLEFDLYFLHLPKACPCSFSKVCPSILPPNFKCSLKLMPTVHRTTQ